MNHLQLHLGIDPGKTGAIAAISFDPSTGATAFLHAIPMPVVRVNKRSEIDHVALARDLDDYLGEISDSFGFVHRCTIERVGSMPKQGVQSAFDFGRSFGTVIGLMAAHMVPVTFVPPATWKKSAGLIGKGKDASRVKASSLWPASAGNWSRVKDDGVAEAALIALWGATS